MRYLILSDIHSNLTALNAALDAAKGRWEEAVCLGDVVGYGPDPNEVIDRLRELKVFAIRGNHDKAMAGLVDAEEFNPVARFAALWTRERLSSREPGISGKTSDRPGITGSIFHGPRGLSR